ncbi:MAG: sugar nucleotide-binding protein [Planctomycetota bacterium]
MTHERWLVTGASGQLGGHVVRQLADELARGDLARERSARETSAAGVPAATGPAILALAWRQPVATPGVPVARIDLADLAALRACVAEFRPTHVIHLAALTAVADCHARPADAERLNVEATGALADAAASVGARFVFSSTDMVFAGDAAPYRETDPPAPLSHYGRTKVAAERLLAGRPGMLTVRIPLMYGLPVGAPGLPLGTAAGQPPGMTTGQPSWTAGQPPATTTGQPLRTSPEQPLRTTTFMQQLAALRAGTPLRLFADEYRTPVALADAARALITLARSGLGGTAEPGGRASGLGGTAEPASSTGGLIHIAGPQRLSRYELIARCAAVLGIERPNLIPISRADIPAAEPRPADLSLVAERFNAAFPHVRPGPVRAAACRQST